MQETFAKTDTQLIEFMEKLDQKRHNGEARLVRTGSCATVLLIVGNEAHIANLGDSSCVLYRRKATPSAPIAEILSFDHKASVQSERDRIAAAGGTTEQKTQELQGFLCWSSRSVPVGPVRVQPGGLAVSRAFGAAHAKVRATFPPTPWPPAKCSSARPSTRRETNPLLCHDRLGLTAYVVPPGRSWSGSTASRAAWCASRSCAS